MAAAKCSPISAYCVREMASVLLVDDDPASRLTLQTLLRAGGSGVDTAATAAEAMNKMDAKEYSLVLSDLHMESPEAGLRVMAHARMMDYRPATALVSTWQQAVREPARRAGTMLIEMQNIPEL